MFGVWSAIAELLGALFMLFIAIGLAILHPIPTAIALLFVYFGVVLPIWRWLKKSYRAEARRQQALRAQSRRQEALRRTS